MRRFTSIMLVVVAVSILAAGCSAQRPEPVKMVSTPSEKLTHMGTSDGMPPYPAEPLPGFPGMDGDKSKGRPPRGTPQLVAHPGSVEHYTPNNNIQPKINPYNHRTLVKSLPAVESPGIDRGLIESFAEPVQYLVPGGGQWKDVTRTGDKAKPVQVVRLKPAGARLKMDLPPLPTGMYVVRLIGALQTADVLENPKSLVVEATINDGPDGEVKRYVLRHRGTDNFYPVGEFFFHITDARPLHIEVGLHADSDVDLLAHCLDVHDVLGECAKRAGKTASLALPAEVLKANWGVDPETRLAPLRRGDWKDVMTAEQVEAAIAPLRKQFPKAGEAELLKTWRQQRDARLWDSTCPLNVNLMGDEWGGLPVDVHPNYPMPDPATQEQLKEKGLWPLKLQRASDEGPWRLVEKSDAGEKTVYTLDDLNAGKPLPGLPFEVPPWGKRFEGKDGKAYFFSPVTPLLGSALLRPKAPESYVQKGDVLSARDEVIRLVRYAYDLPAVHPNRYFSRLLPASVYAHQRWRRFYQYLDLLPAAEAYDRLFPVIQNNQEIADAVHAFVPWVQEPQDVVALLDTYLLQYSARQLAYWRQGWYDHGSAGTMGELAALQMDPQIASPWVDIIFSRTWEYPFPSASYLDYLYAAVQRDGTTAIGSSYYTGAAAVDLARSLEVYIRNGGNAAYDLTDAKRFPRVIAGLFFSFDSRVAGLYAMSVGDVAGFYRQYDWDIKTGDAAEGWRWTHDPRFAWVLVNKNMRGSFSDKEWEQIVEAAKGQRNPYFANRSRIMSDWGGVLEGGTASDDLFSRHAARVRVGRGLGHQHADTLDLGIWSLGVPVSICGGARADYGFPETTASLTHNLVTVDGRSWQGAAWVGQLADMPRCQYLRADSRYQKMYSRQVGLVELDEGRAGDSAALPRAYVVDVCRTIGGKQHMYNFHGFPHDEFAINVQPGTPNEMEKALLKQYTEPGENLHWAGQLEEGSLTATWRLDRTGKTFKCPKYPEITYHAYQAQGSKVFTGAEQTMLGPKFSADAPRRFLRVHVPNQKGNRVVTGEAIIAPYGGNRNDGEYDRGVHLIPPAAEQGDASSLFLAVWEPYLDKPVIKQVAMEGDAADAASFVVAHVETVDGIRDLTFADVRGGPARRLADETAVQADFAYISRDADGLRQVSLVGGKSLQTEELTLTPAVRQWSGRVTKVDYAEKTAVLDNRLPAKLLDGAFFEVGVPARDGHAAHWTTFQAAGVVPAADGKGSTLTWRKGADVYGGEVTEVQKDPKQPANTLVKLKFAPIVAEGENTQLTLTSGDGSQMWRCDVLTKPRYEGVNALNGTAVIYNKPVKEGQLKAGDRIWLYEFGVGDLWRTPSTVTIKRVEKGVYEVRGNTACTIRPAETEGLAWSSDGKTFQPVEGRELKISLDQLAAGPVYVKGI